MGLSKKLGNASNQKGLVPEYLSVEYKWSTQSYTLQDIMDKFKLPCVVQCATDQCSILWSKFQFDLRYPLLLYSKRTVRKVHARNLTTDTKEEFGPSVAIPEDYEGWFGATPKGTNQTKRHTRIEGIANSNTLRFLVSSKCPAYTRSSGPDGCEEYISRDIIPGETFKRVCIMEDAEENDDPDTPNIVQFNGPCLECLDDKDDDVIIPLSRRAMSYEISEFYPDADHKVFNVNSIISAGNSKLPRIVSLVHGERPILDYSFTGLLRCYSVFTEETILAATLDDTSPVCLEMTTDSTAKFKLSLNEASIKRTCEYNNAFQLCKTSGDAFLMGIKVSFSVQPEPEMEENMSAIDMQSTASDMQEVDANSEFEIAWSSSEQTTSSSKSSYKVKAIEKGNVSMTDNFVLLNNDASNHQLPRNVTEVRREDRQGRRLVPDIGNEDTSDPPVDFTEQEIADLMVRKGMIQGLGTLSSSDVNLTEEIETLRRTKVKMNPIYYCSELSSEMIINHDETKDSDPDYTDIDELALDANVACADADVHGDIDEDELEQNCEIVEVSLDESEFGGAICTKANEYHSDSEGGEGEGEGSDIETSGEMRKGGAIITRNSIYEPHCGDGREEEEQEMYELPVDVPPELVENEGSNIASCGSLGVAEVQTIRKAVSSDFPPGSSSVEFLHGLNVTNKATSSEMMNKKKWWNSKRKGDGGSSILNKFKSESNISKIFDRLKGNDVDKSISSSKTRLLQLKPSLKSSSKCATRNELGQNNDDNVDDNADVIEC